MSNHGVRKPRHHTRHYLLALVDSGATKPMGFRNVTTQSTPTDNDVVVTDTELMPGS